jgi:endonuclease/exonuclease/phosphatase family metal-dependent hydrolase
MPDYSKIDATKPEGRRTAKKLYELRAALRKEIPKSERDGNLIIASWNLRELGRSKRLPESIHYVAEIMSRFDVVAVQEVRGDLGDLKRVLDVLGPWWKYLLTDVTVGTRGNDERLAFIYNSRKVDFGGFSHNIVLDPKAEGIPFSRTPYQVGFHAGWFRFQICTTHAYYGEARPDEATRRAEIRQLAEFLAERAKDDEGQRAWARHTILLGDFNIFKTTDKTRSDIEVAGFVFPKQLANLTSGFGKDGRHYDQIAFHTASRVFGPRLKNAKMGAFDFFQHVFKDDEAATYGVAAKAYPQWRTHQVSDHKPLWLAFTTDASDVRLWYLAKGSPPKAAQRRRKGAGSKRDRSKAA